jgi:hypothetical protein
MVHVQRSRRAYTCLQTGNIAVELEATAFPADSPADCLNRAEFRSLLLLDGSHKSPAHHDGHDRAWARTSKLAKRTRVITWNASEKPEHINKIGSRCARFLKINNLTVIQKNGEALKSRSYAQDSSLATERKHLECRLKSESLQITVEYPPLRVHFSSQSISIRITIWTGVTRMTVGPPTLLSPAPVPV